jgi:hypothetical protein
MATEKVSEVSICSSWVSPYQVLLFAIIILLFITAHDAGDAPQELFAVPTAAFKRNDYGKPNYGP